MQNQTNKNKTKGTYPPPHTPPQTDIHTDVHTQQQNQNNPKKRKYRRLTWQAKETKDSVNQLEAKLTKAQTRKQNQSKVPTGE